MIEMGGVISALSTPYRPDQDGDNAHRGSVCVGSSTEMQLAKQLNSYPENNRVLRFIALGLKLQLIRP
ncbi:hypothetical protein L4D75_27340 [Photobacterium indicum]